MLHHLFVLSLAPSTQWDDCSDGELRLRGNSSHEGRVEICLNHAWGTVCDSGFTSEEATVVCRQEGQPYNGEAVTFHRVVESTDSEVKHMHCT